MTTVFPPQNQCSDLANLTPHPITLRCIGGEEITLPSSGRAEAHFGPTERVGAAVVLGTPRGMQGLPCIDVYEAEIPERVSGIPEGDGFVIVSSVVGAAMRLLNHPALPRTFVLGTGPKDGAIRDEQGRVTAVTRLKKA